MAWSREGDKCSRPGLARRWGGDTKSLHVSCSRPLQKTRASPESCSGAKSSHAKEVMAGEIQAHVASKLWGQIAHPFSWGSTEVPGFDHPPGGIFRGFLTPPQTPPLCFPPSPAGFFCLSLVRTGGPGLVFEWDQVWEIPRGDGDFGTH